MVRVHANRLLAWDVLIMQLGAFGRLVSTWRRICGRALEPTVGLYIRKPKDALQSEIGIRNFAVPTIRDKTLQQMFGCTQTHRPATRFCRMEVSSR